MNRIKSVGVIILLSIILSDTSCKKIIAIPSPEHIVIGGTVFTNDANAISAISGIYAEMAATSNSFASNSTTLYAGMAADELYFFTTSTRDEFQKNEITQSTHGTIESNFWNPAYKYIYAANACLEGIRSSPSLSSSVRNMVEGEAKFIRAFCYFELINLFGDVPLVLQTDYSINAKLARTTTATIYQQIISDLTNAKNLLTTTYPVAERVRPNKWAAVSLLARVYLYQGEWDKAEAEATNVLNNNSVYQLVSNPSNVFLKNSTETIWQLQSINPAVNTWEGNAIVPASTSAVPTYLLNSAFVNAFETGDTRKTSWVNSRVYQGQTVYYPYKYKVYGNNAPITEYYMMLRLAEIYLIRAEARARQNNVSGAKSDLNVIRNRVGLANTAANDQTSLYDAIEKERRIELFAEWGHRWFDLKRTGKVNAVIGAIKPITWQPTDALWPIPINQINLNQNLTQNPGY